MATEASKVPISCSVQSGDQTFKWGSYLSRELELDAAIAEATAAILGEMGPDSRPDLALVFASNHWSDDMGEVVGLLRKAVPSVKCVFGCTVSVFGSGVDVHGMAGCV